MSAPAFDTVEHALETLGCDVGAAECHGMLCGMLCGPHAFDARLWLAHVTGEGADQDEPRAGVPPVLQRLAADTRAALERGDLAFALLLPDDAAPLARRVGAFGAWCRGFLSGLGASGIADLAVLGEDARGFVADVARLGAVADDVDGDDADERAFVELTEFARMGVLVVHSDAAALAAHVPASGTKH